MINVAVDNKGLPAMQIKYNANLGSLEGINDLRMYRSGFNRSTVQENAKQFVATTEYDSHARIKSIAVNIKSVEVYKYVRDVSSPLWRIRTRS